MLDVTMTTEFRPGTNLKGHVAGGNWIFVLPSLDLGQVVTLGLPSASTLATLSRTAENVLLVSRNRRQHSIAQRRVRQSRLANIQPLLAKDDDLSIERGGSDLVVLADRAEVLRYALSGRIRATVQRWLTREGQIYFQSSGLFLRFVAASICGRGRGRVRDSQVLWLTPLSGESHTFAPLSDRATMQFFFERKLTSTSLRADSLKQLTSQIHSTLAQEVSDNEQLAKRRTESRVGGTGGTLAKLNAIARKSAQTIVRACNRGEQSLAQTNGLGRWFGRRGVLIRPGCNLQSQEPPKYLKDLAHQWGISLDSYRWGLSASGDYDSRKLIFFLFRCEQSSPEFVVKMTRAASFNARLEQEAKALQLLEEKEIGDLQTLPRVIFSGTHGGLAIVGETAIDGVPFDRRTTATANCPYARSAIQWLTELGAETATPLAAQPGEIAAGLQRLLKQFSEMYAISADEHAFLSAQISLIEYNSIPLVFQHGDPGRWNVFVTPNGRISFLDWEAAEPNGLPLWDLLYFLRSFCMAVAEAGGSNDRLHNLENLFLNDSAVAELAVESISNYCVETGLASNVVEPLFFTCWMHRALKEATRLSPARMAEGHYVNFLRLCIEKRTSPTLRRLFTLS